MAALLAMNHISVTADFGTFIGKTKEAGYEGVGLFFDKVAEFGYEEGKKRLFDSGLKNCVICYLGFFNQETDKEYNRAREEDLEKIEQAADLGAETVLAVTGPRNNLPQEKAEQLLLQGLKELTPAAAKAGVTIALEPIHHMYSHNWTFVTTLKKGLEIVNQVDSDSCGLMFDTYHVWQEPGLLETIQDAAGKIRACQINDWRPITRGLNDRTVPGEGCIPLRTLLKAVQKAGFSSWYDVEIFSEELWQLEPSVFLERCKRGYESIWTG